MTHSTSTSDDESFFLRLGGAVAIARLVGALYDRVQADPELAPYFHTTDMDSQRRRLGEMLTDVLGGPSAPWILDLRTAHLGRGVSNRHFSLLCGHLIDVLAVAGVETDDADDVVEWVGRARPVVVED